MANVKGCDLVIISKSIINKIENGKLFIDESLNEQMSLDKLKEIFEESKQNFIDINGVVKSGVPMGHLYAMLKKKEDKKKYLLGVAYFKRIPGEDSGKTGIAKIFEESVDSYDTAERFFAEGFQPEEEYFDECVLNHLKDQVGMGQVKSADYLDKSVVQIDKKNIGGIMVGKTVYFIGMWLIWGFAFKNWGLGLCFAFLFLTSFTMITAKSKTETTDKEE